MSTFHTLAIPEHVEHHPFHPITTALLSTNMSNKDSAFVDVFSIQNKIVPSSHALPEGAVAHFNSPYYMLSCFVIWKWMQSNFPSTQLAFLFPSRGNSRAAWSDEEKESKFVAVWRWSEIPMQLTRRLRSVSEYPLKPHKKTLQFNTRPLVWENFESFTCLRCPFKSRRTTKKIGTRGHKFIAGRCSEFLLRWGPWIMTDQPTVGRILSTWLMFWDEFISCISSDDFEKSTQQRM